MSESALGIRNMFYFLHRLMKWVFMALVAAGMYWLWLQREALEPAYAWFDVYQNGGLKNDKPLHTIRGKAIAVVDSYTVQVKEDGRNFSVRLTGLQMPEPPLSNTDIRLDKERRQVLRDRVVGNEVEVQVSFAAPGSMLGIVSVGGTNMNLYFITNGMAKFNPAYIKPLPRMLQYQFFAAERFRQKQDARETALAAVTNP
jgi:hypothetical protein